MTLWEYSEADRVIRFNMAGCDLQLISNAFQLVDPNDKERFFTRLRKLDVNNENELTSFLNDYKYRKVIVSGFNRDLVIVGRNESTVFDDFTLQVWKKYYIDEDVVQIGILQGTLSFPVEVRLLFKGNRVYKVTLFIEIMFQPA